MIKEITAIIASGKDLTQGQMSAVMEEILCGEVETEEIVPFLEALNKKGETIEELVEAALVMRTHVRKVCPKERVVLDTCGTGGDRAGTFNISTSVAFVASACGIIVAKHGNRAVSSSAGSADILEKLGVDINLAPEKSQECLEKIGIAFLFAQNLHPAMKYVAEARKKMGKRTIFNLLGPLSNPACATHQLIGVFDQRWTLPLAEALAKLGSEHALVVHGNDGLDEITTTDSTVISEESKGKVKTYEIKPEDFGFKRVAIADLAGGDTALNAQIFLNILKGAKGAKRDIVLLNAAAAIYAADKVKSIQDGIELAKNAIDSGKAFEKFELLKGFSHD
ncbi:MAG: anthranilate phosphoribosyltransferase [Candidatus Omnitrophica bacterium]|nr:anthranilate phosphoribosyltransferase [Candidatus Omnitrophota bacterium]MDD5652749.1 anthranilate phosphoribosyltransferase [Candidatus Omnitrophota bacterium]